MARILLALAGMPANRAFLKMAAPHSDLPKKIKTAWSCHPNKEVDISP